MTKAETPAPRPLPKRFYKAVTVAPVPAAEGNPSPAFTVHLDGKAVRACTLPMSAAAGLAVTTIEGLDSDGMHPAQKAWRDHNVPQCGFCQCGQIMQAAAFLAETPDPTDAQITEAMAGNICRCGCYQRIHAAVRAAAVEIQSRGA